MTAAGKSQRKLTDTPNPSEMSPEWSPSSRTIAFLVGTARETRVDVIESNGSRQRTLARNATEVSSLSWDRAARRITFVGYVGSGPQSALEVYTVGMDETGPRALRRTNSSRQRLSGVPSTECPMLRSIVPPLVAALAMVGALGMAASFAAAGDEAVPAGVIAYSDSRICRVNADGTALRCLTRGEDYGTVSWSANGNRLAFERSYDITPGERSEVWTVRGEWWQPNQSHPARSRRRSSSILARGSATHIRPIRPKAERRTGRDHDFA